MCIKQTKITNQNKKDDKKQEICKNSNDNVFNK